MEAPEGYKIVIRELPPKLRAFLISIVLFTGTVAAIGTICLFVYYGR